jgi:thiol peroxidase
MIIERFGIVKFRGVEVTVIGPDLKPGESAPEFSVQTLDWSPFKGLADTQGKVRIIAAVPSLDTDVCDRETRRFNLEASALSKDIAILVISTDLPFAQKRWCGAAGVDQVTVLSDHLSVDFGSKYGCLIKEARIRRGAGFCQGSSEIRRKLCPCCSIRTTKRKDHSPVSAPLAGM